MSAAGGTGENICFLRVFRILTQNGLYAVFVSVRKSRIERLTYRRQGTTVRGVTNGNARHPTV
jgi:hypothetical protein